MQAVSCSRQPQIPAIADAYKHTHKHTQTLLTYTVEAITRDVHARMTNIYSVVGLLHASRQGVDKPCQMVDVSELREENRALGEESHSYKERAFQQRLMETSLRHKMETVETVRYLDTKQTVRWQTLPHFLQNETCTCTINCVAAVGNTTVATYWTGSDIYTLEKGSAEWTTHKGLEVDRPIRNVFSYQDTCYVAAGSRGNNDKSIYTWSLDSHAWHHVTDMPEYLRNNIHFSLVRKDDHIYMLGGLNGRQPLNTAAVYEIKSDKWHPLPNMPFTSFLCSAVFINKTLYVAGGRTKHSSGKFKAVTEVAALDMNEPKWRNITQLNSGHATVTALHDKLIATGGESLDGHVVNNVEVFDTISGQWLPLPPMGASHYYHGVCVTENSDLVVVGGYGSLKCEYLNL